MLVRPFLLVRLVVVTSVLVAMAFVVLGVMAIRGGVLLVPGVMAIRRGVLLVPGVMAIRGVLVVVSVMAGVPVFPTLLPTGLVSSSLGYTHGFHSKGQLSDLQLAGVLSLLSLAGHAYEVVDL